MPLALDAGGDGLYLYDTPANGREIVDAVEFGPQVPDLSVGRLGDGTWRLTMPTFGQANTAALLGDPNALKINEWCAAGEGDDFVELFNPRQYPVDLSDLYLTDNPVHRPDKTKLGPLSFVPASGFVVFAADGQRTPGHVNFRLASDTGVLMLLDEESPPDRHRPLLLADGQHVRGAVAGRRRRTPILPGADTGSCQP